MFLLPLQPVNAVICSYLWAALIHEIFIVCSVWWDDTVNNTNELKREMTLALGNDDTMSSKQNNIENCKHTIIMSASMMNGRSFD